VWHVVTGWGNDELDEVGLGGFHAAQLHGPACFALLFGLLCPSTVLRRRSFGDFLQALVAGYQAGRRAEPLLGADWPTLWSAPIGEARARFGIDSRDACGEGVRAAA
jgi:ubiquinone biosynthesis protein Coq4